MFSHQELQFCTRCSLHKTRTYALAGEGNPDADVMLIAQAPGECEDKENRMFVGPSGKILHSLLRETNITEHELYMTNLIKCTLPKNRRPKQEEVHACSYYLEQEIDTSHPSIVVPLGYYATKYLFEKYGLQQFSKKEFPEHIAKLKVVEDITLFPLSHPALVLYHQQLYDNAMKNFMKLYDLMKAIKQS
ncbi:MAG: uracil-DNA glycosylase [Candidatus Cloacimonetes bacterium]|nr:uracil-DNA glycosylase [Candidatus Cloacimonadota bacterium]